MKKLGTVLAICLLAMGCSVSLGSQTADADTDAAAERPPRSCDDAISAMDTLLEDTVLPWLVENEPELIFDDSEDAYDKFIEALPNDIKGRMLQRTADGLAACGDTRWNAYLDE